jgi:hypothetical protein
MRGLGRIATDATNPGHTTLAGSVIPIRTAATDNPHRRLKLHTPTVNQTGGRPLSRWSVMRPPQWGP